MSQSPLKKIIFSCLIALLLITPLSQARAQAVMHDPVSFGNDVVVFLKDTWSNMKDTAGAVAYKNMLSAFLSKVAYDAAVWVASGGTNQETLMYAKKNSDMWEDTVSGVLGDGINSLVSESTGWSDFNVCEPPSDLLKLNLALGLQTNLITPDEPECKINEIGEDWADIVDIEDFSDMVELSFDPAENHIGQFLTIQSKLGETAFWEGEGQKYDRLTDGPVASQTGAISQYIQTPGDWINNSFQKSVDDSKAPIMTYTGEAVADAINVFSSTLFSKLTTQLREGFIKYTSSSGDSLSNLIAGTSGGSTGGVTAAKAAYATLNQPTFNPGGEVDASYELLNEGLIDQTFQLAIENQWTVQEFINYLDESGVGKENFKFAGEGITSPSAGLTRRAIYYLKKYRIVPVGWQIAADFAYQNRNNANYSSVNLADLADCTTGDCLYEKCGQGEGEYSPFCKLVDPDWVLKAPSFYCAKEAYGVEAPHNDFYDQDGNEYNQDEQILTREEVCVDEMSCINEDTDGNCYDYGYCVKDKREYRFEGEECQEEEASCQNWTNSSDNEEYAYLGNTLNYGDCNDENALGCTWYCQIQGSSGDWGCASATEKYKECGTDIAPSTIKSYCVGTELEEDTCYIEAGTGKDDCTISDSLTPPNEATCNLDQVCSPESESYEGASSDCRDNGYTSCCSCSISDYAEVAIGDSTASTENYGLNLDLGEVCSSSSSSYYTENYCAATSCATPCDILEGSYSCTNDDSETCYLETESIEPNKGDEDVVFLNESAESCSESEAGCTEFILAQEAGNNLVYNSSFEIYNTDADLGICAASQNYCNSDSDCSSGSDGCIGWNKSDPSLGVSLIENGSTSIDINSGDAAVYLDGTAGYLFSELDYGDYSLANRSFVVSFDAYAEKTGRVATSCSLDLSLNSESWTADLIEESWGNYESEPITFGDSETATTLTLYLPNDCAGYFDAVQVEEVNTSASTYSDYGQGETVYLNGDRDTCATNEVGCKYYEPVTGALESDVPGIITNSLSSVCGDGDDYSDPGCSQCTSSYVGCDFYQEQPLESLTPLGSKVNDAIIIAFAGDADPGTTLRDNGLNERTGKYCYGEQTKSCYNDSDCDSADFCADTVSIVPSTGETCSAATVGCEEYTNLDTVSEGGEELEYYTAIKQCVKTDDTEVGTFYTWEGSDESGFQLRSHLLKVASSSPYSGAPCTHLDLTSENPNASCLDGGVLPASDCSADYGTDPDCLLYYDESGNPWYRYSSEIISVSEECHPLRNTDDARVYYSISSESTTCSDSYVGCREYKGSGGEDVKFLVDNNFTSCSVGNWESGISTETLETPSESVYLDDCSLGLISTLYHPLYTTDETGTSTSYLAEDLAYVVTLWAKGDGDISLSLDLDNDQVGDTYFTEDPSTTSGAITLDSEEWNKYILGPVYLSESSNGDESLLVEFTGTVGYIDEITLQESNSQYLIKDSADLCRSYEGCQEYLDEDETTFYLKSFTSLCSEDKVGCQAVINTQNNTSPFTKNYNQGNEYSEDDLIIPYDQIELLVVDKDVECSAANKGCQTLGLPDVNEQDESINSYEEAYLINDPDSYESILCEYQQLSCQEYESVYDGVSYFKDPGDKTCYYDSTEGAWYKTDEDEDGATDVCPLFNESNSPSQPMGSVCDSNSVDNPGEYCQEDDDCDDGRCISTESDSGWVGLCDDKVSGCTQYADLYTGDEIFTNSSFEYDEEDNSTEDVYDADIADEDKDNLPDKWTDLTDFTSSLAGPIAIKNYAEIDYSGVPECDSLEQSNTEQHHYTNSLAMTASTTEPCVVIAQDLYRVDYNKVYNYSVYLKTATEQVVNVGLLYYSYQEQTCDSLFCSETGEFCLWDEDCDSYLALSSVEDKDKLYSAALDQTLEASSEEWSYFHSTIGYGRSFEFPEEADFVRPFIYLEEGSGTVYVDELSLKEEENYYYLDYTLDGTIEGQTSGSTSDECVEGVNVGQGCVSFRDDSRTTLSNATSGNACGSCTYGVETDDCSGIADTCDSNVIIQVRPDRVCDQWIACSSLSRIISTTGGEDEIECLELQLCEELNEETGECSEWVSEERSPGAGDDLTFESNPGSVESIDALDQLKDYTGYARVGVFWPSLTACEGGDRDGEVCDSDTDCTSTYGDSGACTGYLIVDGYYLYSEMAERGDLTDELIPDGDFEELYCTGHSKVDTDSKCIIDSQCRNNDIDSYNDSHEGCDTSTSTANDSTTACINETDNSAFSGYDYYCQNHYDSTGKWAFGDWSASDENVDLMVKQYSDDESYMDGESRFSWESDKDVYGWDWNNVLSVIPQGGNEAGVLVDVGEISDNDDYTLSFKAMYPEGYDGGDLINIGFLHEELNTGNQASDYFVRGEGSLDVVFVVDTSVSVIGSDPRISLSNIKTYLAGLPEAVNNKEIDYQFALVEENAGTVTVLQDFTNANDFVSSLDLLSTSTGIGCNWDAIYDTLDMDSGSLTYRTGAEKAIALITDSEGAESSSCTNKDVQPAMEAINALGSFSFYTVADNSDYDDYSALLYSNNGDATSNFYSLSSDYSEVVDDVTDEDDKQFMQFQFDGVWRTYTFGPINLSNMPEETTDSGEISTELFFYQNIGSSGSEFIIDDVSLYPNLEVNADLDKVARSCRAYPESDSLSCSYTESSGAIYRGWMGYCLEYDPENRYNCLTWWPADKITGESSISTYKQSAGYSERSPLYTCLVAKGYADLGFCVEESGTGMVDYTSLDSEMSICTQDSDCGSSKICFEGASFVDESLHTGGIIAPNSSSYGTVISNSDWSTANYGSGMVQGRYPLSAIGTDRPESSPYKVTTRKFDGPFVTKHYHVGGTLAHTSGDGENNLVMLRYLANPLERNIHISEIQDIEFDPGKAGEMDGGDDETDGFGPADNTNISWPISILDGISTYDWNASDDSGKIDTYCKHSEDSEEGVGCFWVKNFDDAFDDSEDIIYAYAYSQVADDSIDDAKLLIESEDVYGQVRKLVGGEGYTADDDEMNPWTHLDEFSLTDGISELNSDYIKNNFITSHGSVKVQYSDEYLIVAEDSGTENWFESTNDDISNGGNVVSVYFDFDDSGYLKQIFSMTWFGSNNTGDNLTGGRIFTTAKESMYLNYELKEPCILAVESVDESGDSYAWAQRLNSDTGYILPGALSNYDMFSSVTDEPYAQITPVDGSPSDWSETVYISEGDSSVATAWPLSCIGDCSKRICSDDYITPCEIASDDCADSNAVCIGVGGITGSGTDSFCGANSDDIPASDCLDYEMTEEGLGEDTLNDQINLAGQSAMRRYKHLFVKPSSVSLYSFYQGEWDQGEVTLGELNADTDYEEMSSCYDTCGQNSRCSVPGYETWVATSSGGDVDEYCGVYPEISGGILVNGQSVGNVVISENQKITLSFTAIVDSNQLPLDMIRIDWGDSNDYEDDWEAAATTHYYENWYDCSEEDEAYSTSGDSAGYCVFKPRVTLVDHWDWCSGGEGSDGRYIGGDGDDCDTYDEYRDEIWVKAD